MVPIHQHMLRQGLQETIKTWIWQHYGCSYVRPHEVLYVTTCLPMPLTSPSVAHTSTGVWGSKIHVQWTRCHQIYDQPTPALTDLSFHIFQEICFVDRGKNSTTYYFFSSWFLLQCLLTTVPSLSVSPIPSISAIKDVPSELPGELIFLCGPVMYCTGKTSLSDRRPDTY